MPAVVPFIPLIAAALGTGGALYSANKSRQQQSNQLKAETALAGQTTPSANAFLQQGQSALGPALNYYTGMLANPREASAPEQNRISSMYAGQAANVRNQYPRGGFGPSAAGNLRTQQNAAQEGVIQNGRPAAAGALSNLGLGLSSLGYQGYGLGANILGNVFNQGLASREQQFNQGAALGNGLFNSYQGYLLSRATTDPGSNNGGTTDLSGFIPGSFSGAGTPTNTSTNPFGSFGSGQTGLYGGTSLPNSGHSGSNP